MCQWWLAMPPYRSWERATVGEAYCFSAPLAGPSRWKGLSAMLLSQPQVSRHAHRQWCFETGRHLLLTALHTFHPHILPYWPWNCGQMADVVTPFLPPVGGAYFSCKCYSTVMLKWCFGLALPIHSATASLVSYESCLFHFLLAPLAADHC